MRIKTLLEQPFNYFDKTKDKWTYILCSTIFVFLVLLFHPYGISEVSSSQNTLGSVLLFFSSISLSTFFGLSISQFVLLKTFGFERVKIRKYVFWFFIEALITPKGSK